MIRNLRPYQRWVDDAPNLNLSDLESVRAEILGIIGPEGDNVFGRILEGENIQQRPFVRGLKEQLQLKGTVSTALRKDIVENPRKPVLELLEGHTRMEGKPFMINLAAAAVSRAVAAHSSFEKEEMPDHLLRGVPDLNQSQSARQSRQEAFAAVRESIDSQPWLRQNATLAHANLFGLTEGLDQYPFKETGYEFSKLTAPSNYVKFALTDSGGFSGKVLEMGPGNHRDARFVLEKCPEVTEYHVVDNNSDVLHAGVELATDLPPELGAKLKLPNGPEDIIKALDRLIDEGAQFNYISGLSILHYWDNETTREILSKINQILAPGGSFYFSVKAEGTTFDGLGVVAFSDERNGESMSDHPSSITKVVQRATMGVDGVLRVVRHYEKWECMIEGSFPDCGKPSVMKGTDLGEGSYELPGQKPQQFYRFRVTKPLDSTAISPEALAASPSNSSGASTASYMSTAPIAGGSRVSSIARTPEDIAKSMVFT